MDNAALDRENKWLSIQEAAEELGVNPRTIRRYIRLGRLDVSRLSNKVVRIRLADLDRLMETGVRTATSDAADEPVEVAPAHPASGRAPQAARPARPSGFTPGRFG